MQQKSNSLKRLLNSKQWKTTRLLAFIYLFIVIVMLVVLISLPNKYKAQGLYAPSQDLQSSSLSSLAGSLGGLAGLAGLNLDGNKRDNLQLALEIVKSKQFIYTLISANSLELKVFAAENWNIESNEIIINPKLYNVKQNEWVRNVKFPKNKIPSSFELYRAFKKNLSISFDKKTKMVKISYEHVSPHVAKEIVDLIVNSINRDIQQREMKEAISSINLLNDVVITTKYAEMRSLLYELIQEQTKRLLLTKTKEYYVLEPIDPPIVAEEKSSPKRGLILIVFTLFYGVCSLLILMFGNKKEDD